MNIEFDRQMSNFEFLIGRGPIVWSLGLAMDEIGLLRPCSPTLEHPFSQITTLKNSLY